MNTKRIIPCLDVDQGRVVKGVKFVGIRDAGDPAECARVYHQQGADELVFFLREGFLVAPFLGDSIFLAAVLFVLEGGLGVVNGKKLNG